MNFEWKEFVPKSVSCLRHYTYPLLRKDLLAGITVGIVSLPLALAFAIAAGVSPEKGLFTAIVAGFLISLFGGSKVLVGGPTAAFVVIIYDIVYRQGYQGLMVITLLAAGILFLLGFCRMGNLIKFIPYPLVIGFTAGIAVIVFSSQVKDFFGLSIADVPAEFFAKWKVLLGAFPSCNLLTCTVATCSLLFIFALRKWAPRIPWGIATIALVSLVCAVFHIPVETIASRYGDIPHSLPSFQFPSLAFPLTQLPDLISDAVTIAFLAAIESLLCAVVADGMMGGRHRPNCELIAQGIGNLGAVFFGGIPATGAMARTAINVKMGGQTPLAGMIHSVTLLCILLFFAPFVGKIPLAGLAAILMVIAWNMSEMKNFIHLFRAPAGDITVMLTAFLLTIIADITVAVEMGLIMALFLFAKRMSALPSVISLKTLLAEAEEDLPKTWEKGALPSYIEVYEISGPFFFGVADSLKDLLTDLGQSKKVFILLMDKVPLIDASGIHALREFYLKCQQEKTHLFLSGVQKLPLESMEKSGLEALIGKDYIFPHLKTALQAAMALHP